MSIEEQNQKKINLSFSLSKALNSRNLNHRIFIVKKMKRNGLLEKKQLKLKTVLRKGRWTKEEHIRFIKACLLYGSKWRKIHEAVRTRTSAQVRSHAQKYLIKLCKKYNIEIKSKRKSCFMSAHLNFPYRRKNNKNILPLDKMSKDDKKILKSFNFYIKLIDIDNVKEIPDNQKIFNIAKNQRVYENNKLNDHSYQYPTTTKQDENFEDTSDNSYQLNILSNAFSNTSYTSKAKSAVSEKMTESNFNLNNNSNVNINTYSNFDKERPNNLKNDNFDIYDFDADNEFLESLIESNFNSFCSFLKSSNFNSISNFYKIDHYNLQVENKNLSNNNCSSNIFHCYSNVDSINWILLNNQKTINLLKSYSLDNQDVLFNYLLKLKKALIRMQSSPNNDIFVDFSDNKSFNNNYTYQENSTTYFSDLGIAENRHFN